MLEFKDLKSLIGMKITSLVDDKLYDEYHMTLDNEKTYVFRAICGCSEGIPYVIVDEGENG